MFDNIIYVNRKMTHFEKANIPIAVLNYETDVTTVLSLVLNQGLVIDFCLARYF